jgi:hypothetical protein
MAKLLNLVTASFLALGLTVLLYWPIYQKVHLENLSPNIDREVSKLDLPLEEDIREILGNSLQVPVNRHELCLKNRNGFHFIHADSNSSGVPFLFYTQNLNLHEYGRKNKLGAMGINFYYHNSLPEVMLYREFDWPRDCKTLDMRKLETFASSTIEYSYVGLNRLEELDLGEKGKLTINRLIVGGYYIDTSKSSVYIIVRWKFFLVTFLLLFLLINKALPWIVERTNRKSNKS